MPLWLINAPAAIAQALSAYQCAAAKTLDQG
jgi:hypothetical protein